MKALLWGRIVQLRKNFKVYLLMFILPIIFFLAFGFTAQETKIKIVIADEEQSPFTENIIHELNNLKPFDVYTASRDVLASDVSEGKADAGLLIEEGSFQEEKPLKVVKIKDSVAIASFEGTLRTVIQKLKYEEKLSVEIINLISELTKVENKEQINSRVTSSIKQKLSEKAPINTVINQKRSEDVGFIYDHQLQMMLGFTLFFTIYTIMFSIGEILNDKKHRVWERLMISPLTRWQIYFGNFLFSFLISFTQILLLILLSKYLMGVNWGNNLLLVLIIVACYIFAMMAIGMFLVSISKTVQQFHSIVPIVAVSMAMIGGAYWPLEIVKAKVLLFLAKLIPVTYAMKAIKEVILLEVSWSSIYGSCAILLLIGIFFMSIGVRLIEQK